MEDNKLLLKEKMA